MRMIRHYRSDVKKVMVLSPATVLTADSFTGTLISPVLGPETAEASAVTAHEPATLFRCHRQEGRAVRKFVRTARARSTISAGVHASRRD